MNQFEVREKPPEDVSFTTQILREKNALKVALIDDLYDERSTDEFSADEIPEFFDAVQLREESNRELTALAGREVLRFKDIDNELLQKLWSKRNELKDLKDLAHNTLFPNILTKQTQLDRICANLKGELQLELIEKGINVDVEKDLKGVSLIFIDFYLGEENAQSVERAISIADNIYRAFSGSDMPLIVLMSSRPDARTSEEDFRNRSGLLRGMFYFAPKEDLGDKDKLLLNIATWAKTLPIGGDIQHFVKTLEDSIQDVTAKFIKKVKSLGLDDYAFIQNLSLQEDGQPLGDYMLWLFNAYLGHLLFESDEAMKKQQRVIDRLSDFQLPPNHTTPSKNLREIYQSAVFNTKVGELSKHPAVAAQAEKRDAPENAAYLHLGDVFIKDVESNVLIVINAECDLAFGLERACDPEEDILFVTGKLTSHAIMPEQTNQPRTEFFEYDSKPYRINWNTKKFVTYKRQEIDEKLTEQGYERKAQMRQAFALEIQNAFATNLTRIGMPVAPPLYHPVRLQILGKEGNNLINLTKEATDGGFWIAARRKNKTPEQSKMQFLFFFTVEFGHQLKNAVKNYIQILKRKHEAMDPTNVKEDKIQKVTDKINQLEEVNNNFEQWFLEKQAIDFSFRQIPGGVLIEEISLLENAIGLTQDKSAGDNYNGTHCILISIVEEEIPNTQTPIEKPTTTSTRTPVVAFADTAVVRENDQESEIKTPVSNENDQL